MVQSLPDLRTILQPTLTSSITGHALVSLLFTLISRLAVSDLPCFSAYSDLLPNAFLTVRSSGWKAVRIFRGEDFDAFESDLYTATAVETLKIVQSPWKNESNGKKLKTYENNGSGEGASELDIRRSREKFNGSTQPKDVEVRHPHRRVIRVNG